MVKQMIGQLPEDTQGGVACADTSQPVAALTFDDGPHPVYTPRLLAVLDKHQVRATFFMVGAAANGYPHLVHLMSKRGHVIGNHTWNHPSLPTLPSDLRREQILSCSSVLCGCDSRLFRPPYGHQTEDSCREVVELGYTTILWSLHVNDWQYPSSTEMVKRLIEGVHPGAIILLHDAIFATPRDRNPRYDRSALIEAIDLFLTEIGASIRFLTIPELLIRGG